MARFRRRAARLTPPPPAERGDYCELVLPPCTVFRPSPGRQASGHRDGGGRAAAAAIHQAWGIREPTPRTTQTARKRPQNRFDGFPRLSRTPSSLATVTPQSNWLVRPADPDDPPLATRRRAQLSVASTQTFYEKSPRTLCLACDGRVSCFGEGTVIGKPARPPQD